MPPNDRTRGEADPGTADCVIQISERSYNPDYMYESADGVMGDGRNRATYGYFGRPRPSS
jgi:hypothetical protein